MRTAVTLVTAVALATGLTACGEKQDKQAEADARAAQSGFSPPSVTSRLDFGGMVERRFRALDRNGDDAITPDELPRTGSRIMDLDRNHDGKVSAIEFSEGMLSRFDRMDLNKDGTLTSDERDQARSLLK